MKNSFRNEAMPQATLDLETAIPGSRAAGAACAVWLWAFLAMAHAAGQEEQQAPVIRHIDIVHMTHTDVGFTDHPVVCRRQQVRYLDIAIDAVLATSDQPPEGRFAWTAETTLAVDDWWKTADATRRGEFLKAVGTGRLEVAAMAMNQTPAMNRPEWSTILHWLPEDLWQKVNPRVAIQNDVNGFPRAGAVALLDRGIEYLFTGINSHTGGPPVRRPSAFWWKMPDGRRLFVWVGDHYVRGFYFFHRDTWRRGPVPESTDTRYRPARPGDFFHADEVSVRAAHRYLLERLKQLEADGYSYPSLILSVTNEWRMDNDPPFPPLAGFVATWKRLGLKPTLRLSSAADAMKRVEREVGGRIPEYTGEWTDWWANGTASGPREVAASRKAKRLTAAALSPVWGPPDKNTLDAAEEIYRDLCLFDEHTWGSSDSVGQPHTVETWGQYNEKSRTAYRPMALAKMILAQRARSAVYPREEGLYVANPTKLPLSGWITMPASALRGDFHSLEDSATGVSIPLVFEPGYRPFGRPSGPEELTAENTSQTFPDHSPDQVVRFWAEDLPGKSIRRLQLREEAVEAPQSEERPIVTVDEHNWPTSARWAGMEQSLFQAGTGDLINVAVRGFAGRWAYYEAFGIADRTQRDQRRSELLEETVATANQPAGVKRNAHTTVYTQRIAHPRLKWATRRMELFNREPRARLTVSFHRTESELPEVFFVDCDLPCQGSLPLTSNGGMPFVPYQDQLPGTCRDYFTIDDWVQYTTPQGRWLWATRDGPLVTFGRHQILAKRTTPPDDPDRILAMVFNSVWLTNFVADSHGVLEFQFEMAWQKPDAAADDPGALAETLQADPQVIINPGLREHPIFIDRLHRP